ncbi:hypothetical protein BU023_10690 [Staphylococcus simulans]|nr:hypothetical protein BU023_10690 [Staphylococcus simulans]RIN73197.1 hypothetical protein BU028_10190 [Staphylococcus simulans]
MIKNKMCISIKDKCIDKIMIKMSSHRRHLFIFFDNILKYYLVQFNTNFDGKKYNDVSKLETGDI